MEEEDRKKILQNLVQLVEETNLKTLIPELLKRGIFTSEMVQKYEVSCNQEVYFWNLHIFTALC
jgi:hypothetical protein